MTAQTKKVVYLQRQSNSNAGTVSAMLSVAGFLFALGVAYTPEASKPLGRSIMGLPSAFEWIDTGKWPPLFLCHIVKNSNKMNNTKKTAGETANTITLQDLQKQLDLAWDEMVDDGEIFIGKEEEQ